MHVSAKVDYGMRALLELATVEDPKKLVKGDDLAKAQDCPVKFLEGILRQLRQAGIVASMRGAEGGYRLDQPASEITVADVVRALDGPLAAVRGERPEAADYKGAAVHLQEVWVAMRASMRAVLEHVTLADIAEGNLPKDVQQLLAQPDAWERRRS